MAFSPREHELLQSKNLKSRNISDFATKIEITCKENLYRNIRDALACLPLFLLPLCRCGASSMPAKFPCRQNRSFNYKTLLVFHLRPPSPPRRANWIGSSISFSVDAIYHRRDRRYSTKISIDFWQGNSRGIEEATLLRHWRIADDRIQKKDIFIMTNLAKSQKIIQNEIILIAFKFVKPLIALYNYSVLLYCIIIIALYSS